MDDPAIFLTFLQNVLGVNNNNASNAITQFVNTFNDLTAVTDDEISEFVQTTHGANSGRAT